MSFRRYESYRDSGVEWLGDVPSSWHIDAVKRHFKVVGGSTPKSDDDTYWDGNIVWITPGDLSKLSGFEIQSTQRTITEEGLASCAAVLVPPGSLILSTRAPIGSIAITGVTACTNQGCRSLIPSDTVQSRFLAYLLSIATKELNLRGKGTTFLELSGDELGAFRIPVPPQGEQNHIVAFLDRETAKIDALVAEQQRLIELLKEKRQAAISHAVTKGLDPSAPMRDSGIEWLGQVPAHWEVKRLKHVIKSIEQGWSPQCENNAVERSDQWGVLKAGCVNGGVFRPTENKALPVDLAPESRLGIRKDDLLISRANTRELVGSAAAVDQDHANLLLCDKLYRLRLRQSEYSPRLAAAFLDTPGARSQIELAATGASSSMLNIGQATILEMPMPIPPASEQQVIEVAIAQELNSLEKLLQQVASSVALLNERRAALISAAVTGKIDVRYALEKLSAAEAA